MAAESVQIVLQGVDQVTPVLSKVTTQLDKTAKVSRSFGQAFQVLGKFGVDVGPFVEVSSVLSDAAMTAGKLKETMQASGTAAKVGLSAAVVAISFQIGTMIHDWISGTELWNLKMQETLKNLGKQADFSNKKTEQQFEMQLKLANAAETDGQRQIELQNLLIEKKKEVSAAEKQLQKDRADLEEAIRNDTFGYGKEDNDLAKEAVKIAEQRLGLLKQQQEQVGKTIKGPTEKEEELARREQASENRKKIEQEILNLQKQTLALTDPEAAARAEIEKLANMEGITEELRSQLLLAFEKNKQTELEKKTSEELKRNAEIDAEKNRQDAERQIEKEKSIIESLNAKLIALRDGEAAAEAYSLAQDGITDSVIKEAQALQSQIDAQTEYNNRLEDLQKSLKEQAQTDKEYLQNLKLKNIELTEGADAAEEFRAKLSGVSEEAIKQGRVLREENKKLEDEQNAKEGKKTKDQNQIKAADASVAQLQAFQSRLLTRSGMNPNDRLIKASEKTVELTARLEKGQQAQLAELKKQKGGTIEVITRP